VVGAEVGECAEGGGLGRMLVWEAGGVGNAVGEVEVAGAAVFGHSVHVAEVGCERCGVLAPVVVLWKDLHLDFGFFFTVCGLY